jgi:glucan phosphoethanolaminetransferase (alkaline phosphatase superfamily)
MVATHRALHGSRVHKIPYSARRTGGEEVHVLVVGESVRRDSWSAYGYSRPTTPYLDALRDEAILLSQATADANLTSWAVPIILTGMTPAAFESDNIRGNLLDLAREAGYRTAWLVNQDLGVSASVGVDPDRLVNPPDFRAGLHGRHDWDEVLLPAFRHEIERGGAPRFIGIHMMGSHWEYYLRYPPAFSRFGAGRDLKALSIRGAFQRDGGDGQTALLDAYDNSTLYTDWFLHQLIEQARKLDVPASVTFFPDHGEDLRQLDGAAGHGLPVYTRHNFEIPAFIWLNGAYRKQHPEIVAALQANADKAVRSHDVFNTVAQLMGISWPEASPERSFASDRFSPDTDMPRIAGGKLVPAH